MDIFSNRKKFVDRLASEVEKENDYLLLKRGKSLDVLKRDREELGAVDLSLW